MSSTPQKPFTRRWFFLWGGGALATAAAGGLAWQFRPTRTLAFPETTLGAAGPERKNLLIVYGSGFGTTAEQALWIGEAAAQAGYAVQVARAENAPAADAFDAVVLGSAIRSSKWMPDVVGWAADNRAALAQKPCALFEASMGVAGALQGAPDHTLTASHIEKMKRYRAGLIEAVPSLASAPIAHLPGCLDYDLLSPMMRIVFPFASGTIFSGDFRDRQMVNAFADTALRSFSA